MLIEICEREDSRILLACRLRGILPDTGEIGCPVAAFAQGGLRWPVETVRIHAVRTDVKRENSRAAKKRRRDGKKMGYKRASSGPTADARSQLWRCSAGNFR